MKNMSWDGAEQLGATRLEPHDLLWPGKRTDWGAHTRRKSQADIHTIRKQKQAHRRRDTKWQYEHTGDREKEI